jgi:hypothetical protein
MSATRFHTHTTNATHIKERKLNIYNVLIKSSLLYGSETWRLTENNKRLVEATEMDALRRSSRISRKERIRNVTIRQQIGLEETVVKEIEQNQLMWYGHVQKMAEGRLPKTALKWIPKQMACFFLSTTHSASGISILTGCK